MNKSHFRLISVVIGVAVVITVIVQMYWNYHNYQVNKERFIQDIQQMLDNSVESYYANLAKSNLTGFSRLSASNNHPQQPDSLDTSSDSGPDTLIVAYSNFNGSMLSNGKSFDLTKIGRVNDSTPSLSMKVIKKNWKDNSSFSELATRVIVSLESDTLNLEQLEESFNRELKRNRVQLDYDLLSQHNFLDSSVFHTANDQLLLLASSSYLPAHKRLVLHFSNNTLEVFKRGWLGLTLSLMTALVIVGALYYLYQVIKHQKEIAELKDDLISNITHEFKTPIATVLSAIEGIEHFNASGDPQKTKKYLSISTLQLQKLNGMVEKLLETSALNKDQIELSKSEANMSKTIQRLVESHQSLDVTKTVSYEFESDIFVTLDIFHFENAISNLLDNAIKYGGNKIQVTVKKTENQLVIRVSNNGEKIPKNHHEQIFEKFFRIPKGDQHDIKGYGIGLYYTRKIVEKHGGQITLQSTESCTTFQMTIPV